MQKKLNVRTARVCHAGVVNQAIITNVTALLFVPFLRLYGFTYFQLGMLTAAGFAAQFSADIVLLFLIDRISPDFLAKTAAAMSCLGLAFYGVLPFLFGQELYPGIVCATVLFAFAGGMLEVVLSNASDALPSADGGGLCLLHTMYAWAQVGLSVYLLAFLAVFGVEAWNYAVLLLTAVPIAVFFLLLRVRLPMRTQCAHVRSAFRPFYLFAVLAVFFGYGAEVVMNQWISSFAAEIFNREEFAAIGCALFAACLGCGGAWYVRLERRSARAPLGFLVVSAFAASGMYILAACLQEPVAALAAAVLCGLCVGALSPGAMSVATDFLPQTGGWLLASLALSQDVGAALLPAVSGALTQKYEMRIAFLVLSVVPLLAAACLITMARLRGRQKKREEKERMQNLIKIP